MLTDLLPVRNAPESLHVFLLAPYAVPSTDPRMFMHRDTKEREQCISYRNRARGICVETIVAVQVVVQADGSREAPRM